MQISCWWSKTETCRSDIYVYFNVNFNVFFKLIKVHCWWVNSTYIRMHGAKIKKKSKAHFFHVLSFLPPSTSEYNPVQYTENNGSIILKKVMSSCRCKRHEYVWENRCIAKPIILALGGVDVICFTRVLFNSQKTAPNTNRSGSLVGSRGCLEFL